MARVAVEDFGWGSAAHVVAVVRPSGVVVDEPGVDLGADRLGHARRILGRWTEWAKRQSVFVRLLLGLAGLAFLAAMVYLGFRFLR